MEMVILYFNLGNIGQPEELLSLIRPYFIINLVSILFVGVFNTAKQFLDGIANTKVAMWVMIFGNVVNIFGNWLLIYGVGPFPELGLAGAGISTTGSRILMALIMVGVIVFKKEFKQYGKGLLELGSAPELLFKALKIRNLIVWAEKRYARNGFNDLEKLMLMVQFRLVELLIFLL